MTTFSEVKTHGSAVVHPHLLEFITLLLQKQPKERLTAEKCAATKLLQDLGDVREDVDSSASMEALTVDEDDVCASIEVFEARKAFMNAGRKVMGLLHSHKSATDSDSSMNLFENGDEDQSLIHEGRVPVEKSLMRRY